MKKSLPFRYSNASISVLFGLGLIAASSAAAATLTWNGGGGNPSDGSGTWDAVSANWWVGASSATWTDNNSLLFGVGSGSSSAYTVTLYSGFAPTIGNLTFANQFYTVSSGTINLGATSAIQVDAANARIDSVLAGGAATLTKTGAGTLILGNANTYSGSTTISAGTLQLGDGTSGHDGSIASSSAITNNATLAFNLFSNVVNSQAITGSGNLTKTGAGTLQLGGNNTYTGTTTINGGTLEIRAGSGWALNGSRLGNEVIVNSGGTLRPMYNVEFGYTGTLANITVNGGGTFDFNGTSQFINNLALNGNATILGSGCSLGLTGGLISYTGASSSDATNLTADILLRDVNYNPVNATVSVNGSNPAGDLTISGSISGPAGAGLTKTGTGTLVLAGANTYSGGTTVSSGSLQIGNANALGTGGLTVNGGTLDLAGNNVSVPAFSGAGGSVTNTASGTATFTTNISGSSSYVGSIADGTGAVALIKSGTGTLVLAGANTYSGGTTVSSGSLQVGNANALGTGGLTVNGGTLDLNGTSVSVPAFSGAGGSVTNMASGTSTLTTNVSGTSTYSGSIANGTGAVALTKSGSGTLILGGSITMAGLNANVGTVQLVQSGSIGAVNVAAGATVSQAAHTGSVYSVLDISSLTLSGSTSSLAVANDALAPSYTPAVAASQPNAGVLTDTGVAVAQAAATNSSEPAAPEAVPEPGTLGLLLTGALGMLGFRRKAKRSVW